MGGCDEVWTNGHVATMVAGGQPYGTVYDGAVAVRGGRIAWVGPASELPRGLLAEAPVVHDARGGWITPGLVDCHTHVVFAGNRAGEFQRRLGGASYEDIARSGGGIRSTVRATRRAGEDELTLLGGARVRGLMRQGVTTVEIKSGYGLDLASEARMLRAGRKIGEGLGVRVRTTFLGAHAVPEEFEGDRAAYVRLVCEEMIPAVAQDGLADAVDAFCEAIAFSVEECDAVFRAAAAHALPVRLHADQLGDSGGAALAARHRALSADHLEHAGDAGVAAMGRTGTVAVLLPGAFYFLGGTKVPPVTAFRDHGVPIAVASDLNPGSSPVQSPLVTLNMACVLFDLTPEEALAGMTRHAAAALGMGDQVGTLEPGKRADMAFWDVDHPSELAYWIGSNACRGIVIDGRPVRA